MKRHGVDRRQTAWAMTILVTLAVACTATGAWAQSGIRPPRDSPKWAIDVYGGVLRGKGATKGSGIGEFPIGSTFDSENEERSPSRAIPSWFLGDGALLFNQVNASFLERFGQNYPQIVALDGMLRSAAAQRQGGTTFGFRLTRQLVSRLGLEISFDRSKDELRVTDAARDAIEASRASFAAAFGGLLALMPATDKSVSATVAMPAAAAGGSQDAVSLAFTVALRRPGGVGAYLLFGASSLMNRGNAVTGQLRGRYEFLILDVNPIDETDVVVIRVTDQERAVAALLGFGLTVGSSRHGVKVDVRARVSENAVRTSIDLAPSVAAGSPPIAFPSRTFPAVQFSTLPGIATSLSGPAVQGLETFSGNGYDLRGLVTLGYYVRF